MTIAFEADEISPQFDITTYINITDDDINEAQQVFAVVLEVEEALDESSVVLLRPSTLCTIVDDDRKYCFD